MRTLDAATLQQLITNAMQSDDWPTVHDLEPRLDATTSPRQPPPMVASALWYAEQGLKIFPLQPRSKIPYKGTRGLLEATTDRNQILKWWLLKPESNLAIATGHFVDVIDIDGPTGVQSWANMKHLPDTIGIVSTPRPGGNHLYVKATGRGNKAAIFPGVDYRGQGGYVVAPPSVNEAGVRYTWRRPLKLPA